jgi:hypothetical protein
MSTPRVDRNEADVLAQMMGADSRRVDTLVSDVGQVKGDVRALHGAIGHVTSGVDELRSSMAVLGRHAVLMETSASEIAQMRAAQTAMDGRVRAIELEMPALKETRSATMRGVWGIVALVCIALLGLVLKSKGMP